MPAPPLTRAAASRTMKPSKAPSKASDRMGRNHCWPVPASEEAQKRSKGENAAKGKKNERPVGYSPFTDIVYGKSGDTDKSRHVIGRQNIILDWYSRLSTRRLTVLPRQISRYSPPNRTYASRRIRLSNYPLPLLACYVSITGITNNQSFSVHLNHFSFPFFHTG